MRFSDMETWKLEGFLRILAAILCVVTACLVGLDRQTKVLYSIFTKTASFRDLKALYAAAAYNVMQLLRSYLLPGFRKDLTSSYRHLAWGVYLLDQAMTYVVFAATTAGMQGSMLAVTGEKSFGWMKVCDKFTRFCVQIGGALLCGYAAAVLMAITSCISAYSLFRFYSSKHFLMLKPK